MLSDLQPQLEDQVRQAATNGAPLVIRGSGSKAFHGRRCQGEPLDMAGHRGVVSYEPTELVITARAGTPLAEIEALLTERGQMLPFEPPHFGPAATWGGMLAAGLSGPRRPWAGAARDAVLGMKLLNGRGEALSFGGQVMKNVAGYDLSRLMVGSLGTLAVILEASVKVLPRPARELTLVHEATRDEASTRLIAWGRQPLPLSASLYHDGRLWLRLSGAEKGVAAAREIIGGEMIDPEGEDPDIWTGAREQTLAFFQGDGPLWRISLPPAAPALDLPGEELTEWAGALRWLRTPVAADTLRRRVAALGGHATLFRGHDGTGQVFQPLAPAMLKLHQRLKASLDPRGIFNPGRMHEAL